jgi:hypothetical protein
MDGNCFSMQPKIWIGTIEVYFADSETPTVWKPAFTTVTTWARDSEEFSHKCNRMLESYGWKLLGIDRARPVSDEDEFGEDVTDMLERTKDNPNAIIYGTFHTHPKM